MAGVGFSAVLAQLTLLRELLAAFSGNELVLGVALGLWLLLTGIGAGLGRFLRFGTERTNPLEAERPRSAKSDVAAGVPARQLVDPRQAGTPAATPTADRGWSASNEDANCDRATTLFLLGLIAIALIPLGQVVAVRTLRDVVFLRGAAVGLTGTALAIAVVLAPFCLVSGALLALGSGLLARPDPSSGTSRAYLADAIGSVFGGVIFSFLLVRWLDHFALMTVPAFLTLGLAYWLARRTRRSTVALVCVLAGAAVLVALARINVDAWTTTRQYAGRIVCRANSPYGRLVVTNNSGQLTFFENGAPTFSTNQPARVEETVHYALSQRPEARRVLLIGGGLSGTAREVLRWDVERVIYVELDPLLLEAGTQLLPQALEDPRIETRADDGRRFVQRTGDRFDVVILDLPEPATAQLNRYFTAEFFAEVKRVLTPGGVVSFGLGRYQNFVGPELAALLSTGRHTLGSSFAQVRMLPGERVYFLGSDAPLSLDIAGPLERHGLSPKFVNRHSLDATLAPDRIADLERAVAAPADLNTDFRPVLFFLNLQHWRSQFSSSHGTAVFFGAIVLILLIYLIRLPALPRLVCAAGFAASGLEVVLLLGFQALYGALYQQIGFVVTVFMAGLGTGAWLAMRLPRFVQNAAPRTNTAATGLRACARFGAVRALAFGIALVAAALPWILPHLRAFDLAAVSAAPGSAVILGLTFILATLVGAQFAIASATEAGDAATIAARLFSADLVGAALGALLVSTLLIPLLGITTVCLLIAALNIAAAAFRK